ncbi:PEP/pyruvate-binding domain-containing protein [Dictyobacter formicarum]|nr:PEP/pyruvate-binding domain-containing protein [Dictyobacter formicarum]
MSSYQPPSPQSRGNASAVLFFEEIGSAQLPQVGGKGANLGELTHAGLPVPPGFCITTEAYIHAAERANVAALLAELAGTAGQARSTEIAATIRERLHGVALPLELADAVRTAYLALGNGRPTPVAVRSSATAEDLPFASFAGQQDTYLNIVGEEALLDAIRRCWASLWTERAVNYRIKNQIDPASVSLSVVVQRMIEVEVAGVLFTANPLTGKRRQAVIDASPGLGEAVVSGAVNPDHFVVNTQSGEIVERRLGNKRVVIQALPDGGTQRIEREDQSKYACLTDEQIRTLARLGAQVEAHYHAPQDTEWAIDTSGKCWLTQARPITTLYPLPVSAPVSDEVLRIYLSLNVAQGVYQPLTPMGMSVFRLFASSIAKLAGFNPGESGPGFLIEAGMRLFLDITEAIRNPLGRRVIGKALPFGEARSAVMVQALESDHRLQVKAAGRWGFVWRAASFITRLQLPRYLLQAIFRPQATHKRVLGIKSRIEQQLTLPPHASLHERLDLIERFGRTQAFRTVGSVVPVLAAGFLCLALAAKLLGSLASADERQTVLRSLPFNPTTEMDLALWSIAQKIAADREAATYMIEHSPAELAQAYQQRSLPRIVQDNLTSFLQSYGHRGVAEIDMGLPRWSDDPTHILGVLNNYLRLKDASMAPDVQFARGAQQAEAMIHTLARRAGKQGWWRGWLVNICLQRTRALLGMREMPKFYLVWILARMRNLLRPIGEELAATRRLEQRDDIFFLTFAEVRSALAGTDMRALVQSRRTTYEQEMRRRSIPRILLSDGSEPTVLAGEEETASTLRGTPASAGRIKAKARVIFDPVGAHLEPGEILVAPSTDPGWTPLFLTAGGLVMEMGGSISHGAVVAREYGIPAVVGVAGATEHIQNGQLIQVDGSAGSVVLLEEKIDTASNPTATNVPDAVADIENI